MIGVLIWHGGKDGQDLGDFFKQGLKGESWPPSKGTGSWGPQLPKGNKNFQFLLSGPLPK